MDPRCTPKRVCNTHVSNELTNLQRCLRSATACSRFPAPIGPEAGAMPADHRFRFEDFQSVQHARNQTIQSHKHQAANAIEGHSLRRFAPEHIELVSKNQDFRLKPCSRPEQPGQRACQQPEKIYHRERTSPDSRLLASRLRFPVGTVVVRAASGRRSCVPAGILSHVTENRPLRITHLRALRVAS